MIAQPDATSRDRMCAGAQRAPRPVRVWRLRVAGPPRACA